MKESKVLQEALLSYHSVLCYLTSKVSSKKFNVYAAGLAVSLTLTNIFSAVLVLVIRAAK